MGKGPGQVLVLDQIMHVQTGTDMKSVILKSALDRLYIQ